MDHHKFEAAADAANVGSADQETAAVSIQRQNEDRNYWKQQLATLPEPRKLPSDQPQPESPVFRLARVSFEFPPSLRLALSDFVQAEPSNLFVTLLAGWQILLHRYTEANDIVVGVCSAVCSEHPVNTFVIRSDFSHNLQFRDILRRIQQTCETAFSHDSLSYEQVAREVQPESTSDTIPHLFQHRFILKSSGQYGISTSVKPEPANIEVSLLVTEDKQRLSGLLEYNAELFNQDTIERMGANYIQLLTSALATPDRSAWQLEILAESERQYLLYEWNQTEVDYPKTLCTHQLFEQRVAENPHAVAIISDAGELTYDELNTRANQLAHHLISLGVVPGKRVAVCLNRSAELVIALLGVLKAGGAYVPLDPFFPADRLAYMIEDSQVSVFISEQDTLEKLPSLTSETVILEPGSAYFFSQNRGNPGICVQPENLAYVIYTSGSTGKPKGVQLKQGSLVNFLCSMQKEPGLNADDVLLSLTTICFDIAVLEIFLPLITGARFVIKPRHASLAPENLIDNIERHRITVMQATPVTWRMLFNHGWKGKPGLKVLCGGEAMGEDLAEKMLQAGLDAWNLYGPTETTIWSSVCNIQRKEDAGIVGHPIANTQFYICSSRQTLQPVGVPGELIIGGDGVAAGYFNREDITREKFIPHPFDSKGGLVYRTGDLAVRRSNGSIEFLGRMDNQVKIRGFRIELGDIEAHLLEYAGIAEAVVIAREDTPGDKFLAAYIVPKQNAVIDNVQLSAHLRRKLPEYMVPSAFITLSSLPLTPNNKIDRKKLPAPEKQISPTAANTTSSTGTVVERIAEIFEQVLGARVTSMQASFFDLGGHSLSALTVVEKISRQFSINLPQTILFDFNSVEKLADAITQLQSGIRLEDVQAATLSPEDMRRVDQMINSLLSIPAVNRQNDKADIPQMKESSLCKMLLAPLYRRSGNSVRRFITKAILKLEGGITFTVTMRKLFKQCYDIEIGDFSSVAFDAGQLRRGTRIGKYCSIFPTALIQNADHPRNTISTHGLFYHKQYGFTEGYDLPRVQVEIGNDVWIGADAKILYPTSKIGDGAVIATGAVVVEDVPPYAIVGGYPARVIRYRFTRETIAKLLQTKWWERSPAELVPVGGEFMKPLEGDRIK